MSIFMTRADRQKLRDYENAMLFARTLVIELHKKHYSDIKQFRPSERLPELILQLDNMTTNMVHPRNIGT